MNPQVIGTCSICGGPVTVPGVWWGVGAPPTPRCERCGAVPQQAHGPVIPMQPAPWIWTTTTTGTAPLPKVGQS